MGLDKRNVRTVLQLLAKAESTDSDAEALAFVEHSYRVLAQIINAHSAATEKTAPPPRRRERRHLTDRRRAVVRSEPGLRARITPAAYRKANEARVGAEHAVDLSI